MIVLLKLEQQNTKNKMEHHALLVGSQGLVMSIWKFTCTVNSNTLSTAITANISANIPAEASSAVPNNSSVYAIKKTGKTKIS